jgi:hypothetical protein
MMRLTTAIAVLCIVLCSAKGQRSEKTLIGTTDFDKHEQHLYAVDLSIVQSVARSESNLVSRIFIFEVTKSDCCDPHSVGGKCFQCCDDPKHVVCTNSSPVRDILGRIKNVGESEWENAQRSHFSQVLEWRAINSALEANPAREVSPESTEALRFWEEMKQ